MRQLNKFEKQTIDEKAKIVRDNLWIFQEVNPPKKNLKIAEKMKESFQIHISARQNERAARYGNVKLHNATSKDQGIPADRHEDDYLIFNLTFAVNEMDQ